MRGCDPLVILQPWGAAFQTGLERLLNADKLPRRASFGLLAHAASLHSGGSHAVELLYRHCGRRLKALFAPEHGWSSAEDAGAPVPSSMHPDLGIPIHSLHGAHRTPTADMLAGIDVLLIDLRDIGVRCYTYVATLRYVLDAAAAHGFGVIVCDRPIPLPAVVDGPGLEPEFASFVAPFPAPFLYGMTPAETARWLAKTLKLNLDLHVSTMRGWRAGQWPFGDTAPPWCPPSPGIRAWESARAYPATVWTEALPSLDCDRGGILPFQVLGAPWLDARAILSRVGRAPPGARLHPHRYLSGGRQQNGIRIAITDPAAFRPVALAARLLSAIADVHGPSALWTAPPARLRWFDALAGTAHFCTALQRGASPASLVRQWRREMAQFLDERDAALLYAR